MGGVWNERAGERTSEWKTRERGRKQHRDEPTKEGKGTRKQGEKRGSSNHDGLLESSPIRLSSLVHVVDSEVVRVGELVVVDLVLCKNAKKRR